MSNEEHVNLIKQGVDTWNSWRHDHAEIQPDLTAVDLSGVSLFKADLRQADLGGGNLFNADLTNANLSRANLMGANLSRANLSGANLSEAYLIEANLSELNLSRENLRQANLTGADLSEADLTGADLVKANLSDAHLVRANLTDAHLFGANLMRANLMGANLTRSNLRGAILVDANLEYANLTGCRVYGISAWNLKVNQNTKQSGLIITDSGEAEVTVDDLEVAQFIYLLLNRKKLRDVLNTITSKAVLLLGRFTPERKVVLDALADELRKHNLLPIIFDFERSTNRDFTETIKILAGLSLFVIVDITKPKSAPQELTAVVPDYQIPFVPILEEGENPYSMFTDFKKYDWVLKPVLKYRAMAMLLENFKDLILDRAWKKHLELQRKKNEELEVISIEDMLGQKEKRESTGD